MYPSLWGIGIGGKGENAESPLETALRELNEETGIHVQPEQLECLGNFDWSDASISYHGSLFLLELHTPSIPSPCKKEFNDHMWISSQQITRPYSKMIFCPDSQFFWHRFLPLILGKSPFSNC